MGRVERETTTAQLGGPFRWHTVPFWVPSVLCIGLEYRAFSTCFILSSKASFSCLSERITGIWEQKGRQPCYVGDSGQGHFGFSLLLAR